MVLIYCVVAFTVSLLYNSKMGAEFKYQGGCALLHSAGPGTGDAGHDTYVRVAETVNYEWTGSYNAAPPICPGKPNDSCPKYIDSWMPNKTKDGAQVFPYTECGDYQGAARTNHSSDRVPYLANVIAGFDPRP